MPEFRARNVLACRDICSKAITQSLQWQMKEKLIKSFVQRFVIQKAGGANGGWATVLPSSTKTDRWPNYLAELFQAGICIS